MFNTVLNLYYIANMHALIANIQYAHVYNQLPAQQ